MKRLALVALFLGTAPVLAQTQPSTQAPSAAKDNPNDRIICEKIQDTGSRIATKKVCMTKLQWEEKRRRDRQDLEDAQQRSLEPTSG